MRYPLWGMGVLGIAALLFVFFARFRNGEAVAASEAPFLKSLKFVRQDDQSLIPETLELRAKSGFYAELVFEPGRDVPKLWNDVEVEEAAAWPFALRICPEDDPSSDQAYELRFVPYVRRQGKKPVSQPITVPQGVTGLWQEDVGYRGKPPAPREWRKGEFRLWTFVTTKQGDAGDFVYEILMYPTAKWLSAVRSASGKPVVLRRGKLRIGNSAPWRTT